MISVKIRGNEPFERAVKRFTRACQKSGLMAELRKNTFYEKPSETRKRLKKEALKKKNRAIRFSLY